MKRRGRTPPQGRQNAAARRTPPQGRQTAATRRTPPRARQAASAGRTRSDYNFDYAGTTGEQDQNEYGGDQYGGGRYGRGPFEQSQRYGARGFDSRTGAYGSLQRQFENRYTSGGYSGLKTSGRALGGPPGAGTTPSRRSRLPRTGGPGNGRTREAGDGRTRAAGNVRTAAAPTRARTSPGKAPAARRRAVQLSDDRIRRRICERLAQPFERFEESDLVSERLDVRDVTVSVEGGMVTLEGTVPERRMKHYIEDLVDACPGVQDIDNRIRVPR